MLLADPVRIREIDAYRSGRIAVSAQCSGIDHLGGDALHRFLPETRVHGGIVLEPLGILAQDPCTLRGRMVLDIYKPLPGGLAAERVIVVLYKTVHEIHSPESVLHPLYIVFVPEFQVTCTVIFYKCGYILLLKVALSCLRSLLKFRYNLLQSRRIESSNLIHFLPYDAVCPFDYLAV